MSNPYPLSIYEIQAGRLPGWANEPILLTIPAGSVTGVLEDFPVMVKLSGSSGKTAADVSKVFTALGSDANRKRICVTASDGITPCYVEIKEWSTATQTAFLWVRVPRINPGEDTHLYLYYDPLHAEMTDWVGDTGEPAAQQVWENGYVGVWHTPSGGQLLDSTRNANHGTIYGATPTTGPLGACLSFDGVDDYGATPNTSDASGFTQQFAVVAMFSQSATKPQSIVAANWSGSSTENTNAWFIEIDFNSAIRVGLATGAGQYQSYSYENNLTVGETHILHMTWKSGEAPKLYVDGTEQAHTPSGGARYTSIAEIEYPVEIGKAMGPRWFAGTISLVAVTNDASPAAITPAWIAATNAALRDDLIVYSDPGAPLTLAGYADAYDYLSWTRRYRRPGAWKAQINRYLPAAKEFIPGRLVHFRRNGEDRLGLIETRQISVDTRGRPSEVWTVAGREIIGILGDRLCLHGVSTGTGYDEFTGAAESALRHYVDANAINPDDARRIVPFLALAPTDDGRGGTTTQKARFDVLADLLESICAASGLGYRGRWSWDDRQLYFEVLQGADRSGSVKLSPALGNCTIKGYNESTGLAPSVAVVAGQGEAAARVVADVGTREGLIGLARRERFVDARDLATEAELQQRGAEKLAEDGDTTTLEVEYIRTASYRYGEDFDLGDIVHVEYPDIAAMQARIVAITEEYAREGEKLTLTLGTEWPDLVSLLRARQKDNVENRI